MSDAERWVTVSEAARLEGEAGRSVNKSSISRFLAGNPDVPVQRDGQGRVAQVEYGALALARGGSLSVADSRALRPAAEAVAPSPAAAARSYGGSDATSRKRSAEAEQAELNLAERKGELLPRAAVTSAFEAAASAFTQAIERRRRALAVKLADIGDPRTVELELKASDRALLEEFVGALRLAADPATRV